MMRKELTMPSPGFFRAIAFRLWRHEELRAMLRSVTRPFPTSKQLGSAIRELRESKGMTLEALAGSAGLHVTYLSRIERRRRNPSWEKLRPLAETLGVDMSEVVKRAEAIAFAEQTTDTSASDS